MIFLRFKDREGVIPAATMRQHFEQCIRDTGPTLQKRFSLDVVTDDDGEFLHYATRDTDMAWVGFALGMRCLERIQQHTSSQD